MQYINELNPGRNVIFATGTPISNTMCEMYLMQKYLQADLLKDKGIYHFDAWAANFGETVTAMELSPEGKGYREKTRFGKFTNLPELVTMFRLCADVQMQESLPYLDIPSLVDDKYVIIESEPNEEIKAYVDTFVERAAAIRNGAVDPSVDNMLKICHDARAETYDVLLTRANQNEISVNLPDLSPVTITKLTVTSVENLVTEEITTEQIEPEELVEQEPDNSGFRIFMYVLLVVAVAGLVVLFILIKKKDSLPKFFGRK